MKKKTGVASKDQKLGIGKIMKTTKTVANKNRKLPDLKGMKKRVGTVANKSKDNPNKPTMAMVKKSLAKTKGY
jgi:hypothetical protein